MGTVLLTCNQPEFAALPPGQIVPILADQSLYNSSGEDFVYGSERSCYRVLHAHDECLLLWAGGFSARLCHWRSAAAVGQPPHEWLLAGCLGSLPPQPRPHQLAELAPDGTTGKQPQEIGSASKRSSSSHRPPGCGPACWNQQPLAGAGILQGATP